MSTHISPLGPIDPSSPPLHTRDEEEKTAPWIVRKLVGSMTGRVLMSSYESFRAAGTSIVCLSPWGDSSPFIFPCIRFRDLAVHTVVAATGGMAVIAAPLMESVEQEFIHTFGSAVLVEHVLPEAANDFFIEKPIEAMCDAMTPRPRETRAVKVLTITLKYKMTMADAALGFYRSSVHKDTSLFSSVKDYLAIEKGWFSPYLFASARRPIIPRTMKPDIVFCHGPFLEGDYQVGEALLRESATVITLAFPPTPAPQAPASAMQAHHQDGARGDHLHPSLASLRKLPSVSSLNKLLHSRPHLNSPPSQPAHAYPAPPLPPPPRRMVILCVGFKPHRKLWTTSARPEESVIRYILLNECPAVVVPVKPGAPLVAWDTLTLEHLWKVPLPAYAPGAQQGKFGGIVNVLLEYLDMHVDWARVVVPPEFARTGYVDGRAVLWSALELLVAAAIRSGGSSEVRNAIDKERSGIAMWRIP